MRLSRKFVKISVIHESVHYFPSDFEYTETGVHANIVYRVSKWRQDKKKITICLANEIKEYAEKHK